MGAILLFLFCILVTLGIFYLIGMAILKMADQDMCFTKNVSGWIKAIVAGDEVIRWIGWIPGYHVCSDTGDILALDGTDADIPLGTSPEDADKIIDKEKTRVSEIAETDKKYLDDALKQLGISFVGLWPYRKIYEYTFKWTEWAKRDGSNEYKPWPREKKTKHIRFRFPYFIEITEAETQGKTPINVTLLITIRIRNASKALFKSGGEWLANVTAAVQSATRDWIGQNTIEKITATQHESGDSGFVKYIMSLNDSQKGNKGLVETLGVEINLVNFLSYENAGDKEERQRIQKAMTEQYVAEQEAEAKKVRANGDASALLAIAEAEAKAIEKKGEAKAKATKKMMDAINSQPGGAQIEIADRIADAIKHTKITTFVAGEGGVPLFQISTEKGHQQERERRPENQDRPNKKRRDDRSSEEDNKNENS